MQIIFFVVMFFISIPAFADCEGLELDMRIYQSNRNSFERYENVGFSADRLNHQLKQSAKGIRDDARKKHDILLANKDTISEQDFKLRQKLLKLKQSITVKNARYIADKDKFDAILEHAKNKDIEAQYCISLLYEYGLGCEIDLVEAYAWVSTSVAQKPPFRTEKREYIASLLSPDQTSEAIGKANTYSRIYTNLFDTPTTVYIK